MYHEAEEFIALLSQAETPEDYRQRLRAAFDAVQVTNAAVHRCLQEPGLSECEQLQLAVIVLHRAVNNCRDQALASPVVPVTVTSDVLARVWQQSKEKHGTESSCGDHRSPSGGLPPAERLDEPGKKEE